MSQERIALIERAVELWNAGRYAEWKEFFAPDVVIVAPPGWPEGAGTHGIDDWFDQAMRLTDSWERQTIELDEIRDLGDRVLTLFRWVARGRDSGIDLEMPMAYISTVRGGKFVRQEYFADHASALEAAGLSE